MVCTRPHCRCSPQDTQDPIRSDGLQHGRLASGRIEILPNPHPNGRHDELSRNCRPSSVRSSAASPKERVASPSGGAHRAGHGPAPGRSAGKPSPPHIRHRRLGPHGVRSSPHETKGARAAWTYGLDHGVDRDATMLWRSQSDKAAALSPRPSGFRTTATAANLSQPPFAHSARVVLPRTSSTSHWNCAAWSTIRQQHREAVSARAPTWPPCLAFPWPVSHRNRTHTHRCCSPAYVHCHYYGS